MLIFNILKDEDKLKIILLLLNQEYCVCDLETALNLRQSTLSNKLRVLKAANIIDVRKQKNWHYYSINKQYYADNIKLFEYIQEKNQSLCVAKSNCEEKNEK